MSGGRVREPLIIKSMVSAHSAWNNNNKPKNNRCIPEEH